MSTPAPETLEREKDKLYLTDAELIRRLGLPQRITRAVLRELDTRRTGFPRKLAIWKGRRYWPDVKAYLDKHNGLIMDDQQGGRHERTAAR